MDLKSFSSRCLPPLHEKQRADLQQNATGKDLSRLRSMKFLADFRWNR